MQILENRRESFLSYLFRFLILLNFNLKRQSLVQGGGFFKVIKRVFEGKTNPWKLSLEEIQPLAEFNVGLFRTLKELLLSVNRSISITLGVKELLEDKFNSNVVSKPEKRYLFLITLKELGLEKGGSWELDNCITSLAKDKKDFVIERATCEEVLYLMQDMPKILSGKNAIFYSKSTWIEDDTPNLKGGSSYGFCIESIGGRNGVLAEWEGNSDEAIPEDTYIILVGRKVSE